MEVIICNMDLLCSEGRPLNVILLRASHVLNPPLKYNKIKQQRSTDGRLENWRRIWNVEAVTGDRSVMSRDRKFGQHAVRVFLLSDGWKFPRTTEAIGGSDPSICRVAIRSMHVYVRRVRARKCSRLRPRRCLRKQSTSRVIDGYRKRVSKRVSERVSVLSLAHSARSLAHFTSLTFFTIGKWKSRQIKERS